MTDPWITGTPQFLPDFIIGGAMKSGTSTLHAILDKHPDVGIAKDELGFFDMDDLKVHPDFNFFDIKTTSWTTQDLSSDPDLYWAWYHAKFKAIQAPVKGEDSTTYLASDWAAERLAKQKKAIKLIFILRHPTQRTLSNYLHALKSGRAQHTLEQTLYHNPRSIIDRSLYRTQLTTYYRHFDKENIKIILFEDLIASPKTCMEEVAAFLQLDVSKFPEAAFTVHANRTKVPKYPRLQVLRNRLLPNFGTGRYSRFLPVAAQEHQKPNLPERAFHKIHKQLNPLRDTHRFTPKEATVQLLDHFFKKEMEGIDQLTGKTIYNRWFGA